MKTYFFIFLIVFNFTTINSQTKNNTKESDSLKIAIKLWKKGDKKAKGIIERELLKAREENNKLKIASALNLLGLLAIEDTDTSLKLFTEALESAKLTNDSLTISYIYGNIGIANFKKRNYYIASKNILKAQDYTFSHYNKIINYTTLSDIHTALDNKKQAVYHNKKALEISLEIKDSVEISINTTNLASTLIANGEISAAKDKLDAIKKYTLTNKNDYYDLSNYNFNYALSEYYIATDSLNKALYYLEKAETFKNDNFFIFELSYYYLLKGKIYYKKNELNKAEKFLTKGFEIDTLSNKKPIDFYPYLSKINAKKGNLKKALKYSEKYSKLTDSMYAVNNSQKLASLLYEHERKAIQQKLLITNKNISLLEANKKKQNLLYLIALFSILIICGFIYYVLKQRLSKKELNLIKAAYNYSKMEIVTKGEEQEKTRLSKYLHDDITGDLATIKYTLSSLNTEIKSDLTKEKITKMYNQLDSSIENLRKISHDFAPPTLLDFTLTETLAFYCDRLQAINKNTAIQFETVGDDTALYANNLATKTTVYRIIQELVSNSITHAKAPQILVLLSMLETKLIITVEDTGIGYSTNADHTGLGIKNIEVRVAMLEGTFEVVSNSKGTKTSIEIPKINL